MKYVLVCFLAVTAAYAQVQILPNDAGASKAIIDSNFAYLNSHLNGVPFSSNPTQHSIPVYTASGSVIYLVLPNCSILGFSTANDTWQCFSTATPSAHAATHAQAGSDPITIDASQTTSGIFSVNRLPAMGASGNGHSAGIVPDPGVSSGNTRFLREDATWVAISGTNAVQLQSRSISSSAPSDGYSLVWNTSGNQWQPSATALGFSGNLSGDVTGGQGTTSVIRLQGRAINGTAPTDGQVLAWSASGNQWQPGNPQVSANATQIQGRNVSAGGPSDQQVLLWNASGSQWQPATLAPSGNATQIQSRNVASTAPGDGQVLSWSASNSSWQPAAGGTASPAGSSGQVQINNGSGGLGAIGSPYSSLHAGSAEYQTPEPCFTTTITYSELTAAATSQQIALGTITEPWSPRVVQAEEVTTFACGGCGQISALGVSIGGLSSPGYYVPSLTLMQSPPNFAGDNVAGQTLALSGAHSIYAQISVTNTNPGNLGNGSTTSLTGGALKVRICGAQLQ